MLLVSLAVLPWGLVGWLLFPSTCQPLSCLRTPPSFRAWCTVLRGVGWMKPCDSCSMGRGQDDSHTEDFPGGGDHEGDRT